MTQPALVSTTTFYAIIAMFTVGLIAFSIYWFVLRWRNRFQAHIMQDYRIIKTFRLKRTITSFRWGKKVYKVTLKGSMLNKKNTPVVYYDIDDVEPIRLEKLALKNKSPEDLQAFMQSSALQTLLSRSTQKMLFTLMIVAIIAVGVVAGIGFFFIHSSNVDMQRLFQQYMNVTSGGRLR